MSSPTVQAPRVNTLVTTSLKTTTPTLFLAGYLGK